jgi:hypothetical protein
MSDYVLMAPVGDEYSSVSDELFEEWNNTSRTIEVPIHVAAFWKYNVRVFEYAYEIRGESNPIFGGDYDGSFTVTATTTRYVPPDPEPQLTVATFKEGVALYYLNWFGIAYLDTYVLQPTLLSAHSFEPDSSPRFTEFLFFNHRGKWYIYSSYVDYGFTPFTTLTADLSKITIIYGTVGSDNYQKYTYTCLEPFY